MRLPVLFVAALLSASLAAHADTLRTFDASGIFSDGTSLTGTLTVDTTIGIVTGADLFLGSPTSSEQKIVTAQLQDAYGPGEYSLNVRNAALTLDFDFGIVDGTSLVGYAGGALTTGDLYNLTTNTPFNGLVSGALTTPAAATPEPSSLALLGTGMLAVVGGLRKRFV